MNERIAIVDGIRTPFCKASGILKDLEADDLGAYAVKELMAKIGYPLDKVDELIFGNVLQPAHATNIARIIAVKAGLPIKVPAFTVNRNCASGLEAIVTGANKILLGDAEVIVAGGTESMSGFPVLFNKKAKNFLLKLNKAKSFKDKLLTILSFRPSFLIPEVPELTDPLCSLTMGQTAENIIRDFKITRLEQDKFALLSQQRASKAIEEGRLADEIVPIPIPPKNQVFQSVDDGPRANSTLEGLLKLKPVFERETGSVTAGNSSQVTDGAAAVLIMRESKAKALGFKPLGYLTAYSYVALEPARMGLGPYYAIAKLLEKTNKRLADIDLFEINEAFSGQVLAVLKALNSTEYTKKTLGLDAPIGEISLDKVNVNGGAVALGHPLGASGTRLVITLLKELKRRNLKSGLATMCVGGGQGEAALLERE
jgi:acetyl-CoA acyltransferase